MLKKQNSFLPVKVFYFYASEDEALKDELAKHLSIMREQGLIFDWHNQPIPAGGRLEIQQERLKEASIILLLISHNFLASRPHYEEMKDSLKRQDKGKVAVIPIILSAVDREMAPFAHLRCLPHNDKPISMWTDQNAAFLDVVEGIKERIQELQASSTTLLSLTSSHQTPRRFTNEQKLSLIEKLLACPTLTNRRTREAVFNQLRKKIALPLLSFRDVRNDRRDISILVDICLAYEGGVEELTDIIFSYEPFSPAMDGLDKQLDELFPMVISHSRLRELKDLLQIIKCPTKFLDDFYRASAPPEEEWFSPLGRDDAEKALAMVRILANAATNTNGIVPLFQFINFLIHNYLEKRSLLEKLKDHLYDPPPEKELKKWLEITEKEHGITYGMVDKKFLEPVPVLQNIPSYFLLEIKEDGHEPHLFTVQAWLLDHKHKQLRQVYEEETKKYTSFEDLEKLFFQLIEECRPSLTLEARKSLTIEFSLPCSMASWKVEHLKIKVGQKLSVPVGIEHQVMIRSYERTHYPEYDQEAWVNSWNQYQSSPRNIAYPPFFICGLQHDEGLTNFYARLKKQQLADQKKQHFSSLVLTHTPSEELLSELIMFGIPIALWPREQPHHTVAMQESLSSFLADTQPADLRKFIWEQRMEAFARNDKLHLGRDITLLWDDPELVHPDIENRTMPVAGPGKGAK